MKTQILLLWTLHTCLVLFTRPNDFPHTLANNLRVSTVVDSTNKVGFPKQAGRVAQSVQRLATDWTVRGSNPAGARFSAPVQTGPGAHPASCSMCTGSFPGVESGRGVKLTTHSLLVPWSRKSRATPLIPLWAVQPVESLNVCTKVYFTFFKP